MSIFLQLFKTCIKSAIIVSIALSLNSCKKDSPTRLAITVTLTDQTPVNNFSLTLFTNAINKSNITSLTGSDGKILLDVTANQTYYLYHYSDDGKVISDPDVSYVPVGTFTSTNDIKNSPLQKPSPNIGDTKYADINGDGVVDRYDLVKKVAGPSTGQTITVTFIVAK